MNKIKVLFVDDDVALGNIVTLAMEASGYEAHYQTSLAGIREVVRELQPDIIVLDVEIGARNGIDAVPQLQRISPATPILFVSSHVETESVVRALNSGAMNYLKKPFEIPELLAYIRRYTDFSHSKGICMGMFIIQTEEHLLLKGDEIVKKLSAFEYKLLLLLVQNLNETVTRQQIEQALWEGAGGSEQSLNNYIARLRTYLSEDERIELTTISGIGYKLTCVS